MRPSSLSRPHGSRADSTTDALSPISWAAGTIPMLYESSFSTCAATGDGLNFESVIALRTATGEPPSTAPSSSCGCVFTRGGFSLPMRLAFQHGSFEMPTQTKPINPESSAPNFASP